ncbi:hypothetical protein ACEQ8H_006418 [Pleosporales sp. CAS-2024a]
MMLPPTPPAANLSRSRLKALATWVRDELDLLVAREGPNALQVDDVVLLHETFVALRLASDITALDLRATGIHLVVQDIAGVATRWPGRLCDDCDRIIALWEAKFGSLKNLHPFMFARGGRLEGIAGPTEYSREALLKRWSTQCPERLHPKRSHKLGDLGFRPGDWWIDTLFAHHAGIIGLEAVDGGTTFDKHGAYALVLKDTGEIDARGGENFTYRVPQGDKGKYRLTAATPRSREPIRVLRSHSVASAWGPKAGVRYEGLYGVRGWSIRQAKMDDFVGGQWKEGDVVFEVHLERTDAVPFSQVTIRPTATEIDDYTEYKRLRKLHRLGKRDIGPALDISVDQALNPVKLVPKITPSSTPQQTGPSILHRGTPHKRSAFRDPIFAMPDDPPMDALDHAIPTVLKIPEGDYFSPNPSAMRSSALAVPKRSYTITRPPSPGPGAGSIASGHTGHTASSPASNILDVAPWTDPNLLLLTTTTTTDAAAAADTDTETEANTNLPSSSATSDGDIHADQSWQARKKKISPPPAPAPSTPMPIAERRKSGDLLAFLTSARSGGKRKQASGGGRKSIFERNKGGPKASLFDGTTSTSTSSDDVSFSARAGAHAHVHSTAFLLSSAAPDDGTTGSEFVQGLRRVDWPFGHDAKKAKPQPQPQPRVQRAGEIMFRMPCWDVPDGDLEKKRDSLDMMDMGVDCGEGIAPDE